MDLNQWEQSLEAHARRCETLDLRSESGAGEQPTIRGEVLSDLALRLIAEDQAPRGIQLIGATIEGLLDLEFIDFDRSLELEGCIFEKPPNFEQSHLKWLSLRDSFVPGIHAYQINVDFDVLLTDRFDTADDLDFAAAVIGGRFEVGGELAFARHQSWALDLSGAHIGGDVLLSAERSSVRTDSAFETEPLLMLDSVDFAGRLTIAGMYRGISMTGAHVRANVEGVALQVKSDQTGAWSFNADRSYIDGDLLLTPLVRDDGDYRQLAIEGGLSIVGAHLGGALGISAIQLGSPANSDTALNASAIETKGNILIDALIFDGGPAPNSLDRSVVRSNIQGAVDFSNGQIGGHLTLAGSQIHAKSAWAIDLTSAKIERDLTLGTGPSSDELALEAHGGVSLRSAQVGGVFGFYGTAIAADSTQTDEVPFGLSSNLLHVGRAIIWEPQDTSGMVDFSYVDTIHFQDNPDQWPEAGMLNLEGFSYQTLVSSEEGLTAKKRLEWLALQSFFRSDSYDTLRSFYLRRGDRSGAAEIAIAKYRAQAAERGRRWVVLASIYDRIAGCGYKPVRSIIWLGGLWLMTALVLSVLAAVSSIIVSIDASPAMVLASECSSSYPCFSAFRYSFETVIPLVGGQQLDEWRVDTSKIVGTILQIYLSVASALGLLFSTTAIGALTGLLRRD